MAAAQEAGQALVPADLELRLLQLNSSDRRYARLFVMTESGLVTSGQHSTRVNKMTSWHAATAGRAADH